MDHSFRTACNHAFPTSLLIVLLALLATAGCGDPCPWVEVIDGECVLDLPEGDGEGSALSGTYDLAYTTTSCSGDCWDNMYGTFVCEIGTKRDIELRGIQNDGAMVFESLNGTNDVYELRGGVDNDGRFDVGGYSVYSVWNYITRMRGVVDSGGTVSGEKKTRIGASFQVLKLDCLAVYTVTGQRK